MSTPDSPNFNPEAPHKELDQRALSAIHVDPETREVFFDCKELIVTDCGAMTDAAKLLIRGGAIDSVGFRNGSIRTELTPEQIINIYSQDGTEEFMTAAEHFSDISHEQVDGHIVNFLDEHRDSTRIEAQNLGLDG